MFEWFDHDLWLDVVILPVVSSSLVFDGLLLDLWLWQVSSWSCYAIFMALLKSTIITGGHDLVDPFLPNRNKSRECDLVTFLVKPREIARYRKILSLWKAPESHRPFVSMFAGPLMLPQA